MNRYLYRGWKLFFLFIFFLYFSEAKKNRLKKKTYNARNQNGVHKVLQVGYKEVEKCVVFFKN